MAESNGKQQVRTSDWLWRIVTILFGILASFASIMWTQVQGDIKNIKYNDEELLERIHGLEIWRAETTGNRFKQQDGVELRSWVLDNFALQKDVPPPDVRIRLDRLERATGIKNDND